MDLLCFWKMGGVSILAPMGFTEILGIICARLVILPAWPVLMGLRTTVLPVEMLLGLNIISSSGPPYAQLPAQLASTSTLPTPIPARPVIPIAWDAQCRQLTALRIMGAMPIFFTATPPTNVY